MNKGKIAITIIKCVTAIVCCAAVSVTSTSVVNKVCDNREAIANIALSDSTGSYSDSSDDYYSEDSASDDYYIEDEAEGNIVDGSSGSVTSENAADSAVRPEDTIASDKVITVTSGLNSTNKAEVLKYYQMVMTKNEKDGLGHNLKLTLIKLDGGSGGIGELISMFEPVAKRALAENSTPNEGLPGVHDQIKVTDIASAKAVNDGRYTTVTMNIVEQTDGPYGKVNEGPVGRTIGVLDGVALAIEKIKGFKADFQNGSLALHYKNPKVVIKVDNKTGALVKGACSWNYQVHVEIEELAVEMSIFSLTLHGTSGIVELTSSY
ncbi:MAG: hypothetical protein IJZ88_02255 [Clostridia bacterium]|nr:hypothetical protein [Clostridia bacterium]